jgi:Helix-turn-helix domain/HRDC domain
LTATNSVAQNINARNLAQLPDFVHIFHARIEGEFPPGAYPTEETLEFKAGAQVMFVKNDMQAEKRFYNGKIGRITAIDDDTIYVKCPGDPTEIMVTPAEWLNVKYSLNEVTKEIDEQVLGVFTHFPLKLAWAITIHKSQGLTFERAIIDAQAAFAHGQVYVALSRCKSFEGIVLRSPIGWSSVKTDPIVKNYTQEAERNAPNEDQIQKAKREYQQCILNELFGFQFAKQCCDQLCRTFEEHKNTLTPIAYGQVHALAEKANAELFQIAEKFAPQLAEYLCQDIMPSTNESLQVRVRGAGAYFVVKIAGILQEADAINPATDNVAVQKTANSQLRSLKQTLFVRRACFAACSSGFTTEAYLRAKVHAELDFLTKPAAASATQLQVPEDVPHPSLYQQLLQWRKETADERDLSVTEVLPTASLRELVTYLPTTSTNLRLIRGIGKVKLKRYGEDICRIIREYCETNQLPVNQKSTSEPPPSSTSETKLRSLEMFQAGKNIEQIALERSLSPSTIEGHLAHFIGLGQFDIFSVLKQETILNIQEFFLAHPLATMAEAKSHFGEKYSYGELRMVLSHLQQDLQKKVQGS